MSNAAKEATPAAPESRAPRWFGPVTVAVMIVVAAWAWWLERPPSALPADAPAPQFSAYRALRHLEQVAVRPHMPGSAEHGRVREYLVGELEALGFEVQVQQTTVVSPRGRTTRAVTVRNILARRRGAASTGGVALAAHYDSQQLTPGAGDDGTGVVAILESLRAMGQDGGLRNDLYVVITDAEELGLMGARGFVNEHPWWPQIDVLLSFEARGGAGQAVMFETNVDNGWVVREFARADPYPTGSSLYYEIYQRLPNDTDFSVFKRAGVTGLNFAMAEGADRYHRPTDTIENLSLATVQHQGEHALSLARHFGALDLRVTTTAPDIVYFRAGPLGLIHYGAGWAFPLALLTTFFYIALVRRGTRAGRVRVGGIGAGFVLAIIAMIAGAGSAWLLWQVVQGVHHELGSVIGRALYNEAWYVLATAALCVGVVAELVSVARRYFSIATLALGAALLPLTLALLSGWFVPGVSMLFQWPTVFAILVVAYLLAGDDRPASAWGDLAVVAVLSLPIVGLLFPLVWGLYVGLNITSAPIIAVVITLLLILLLPLFDMAQLRGRRWLPATAFAIAAVFANIGVIGAFPGPTRPIPSDLVYALDREAGTSVWATMQGGDDGWVEGFVDDSAETGDLAPFLAGNPRTYRRSPAPLVDAPRAAARVVADTSDGRSRRLRVEIEPAMGAELINISPAVGAEFRLVGVNGVPVGVGGEDTMAADWLLQHYGEPPGGVLTLDFITDLPAAPLEIVVVEFQMRFPQLPGVDTERPAGWVAHARRLTDASLFRQLITIE